MPGLRATPFLDATDGDAIVLTDQQRADLAHIGTRLRVPRRTLIYEQESEARWIYAIVDGVVKSYHALPSGKRSVAAFLFPRDLFGLAKSGRYVNSTQSVTPATLYRFPIGDLAVLLKQRGDLQFKFLLKVTHELREAQRRAILINRRDAAGRLAMFVDFMAERANHSALRGLTVTLPMSRSDIAAFVGLSPASVSRAIASLALRGLAVFDGRHHVRILDPAGLKKLVAAV
jgi:CRP-like cAMP-binding protein